LPIPARKLPAITREDSELPPPDGSLLRDAALFLDLDGTLLDIKDLPHDVVADQETRDLLSRVERHLDGRLAVVSGRSLSQIDDILGPIAEDLAISGSHGCEHRWKGIWARPNRPAELDHATARMRDFAGVRQGVLLEEKSFGAALHYRLKPEAEQDAHALAEELARDLGLVLQTGKRMVELRVAGGDKGVAVHRLMGAPAMRGSTPVFIGDDVTDEAGFVAAQELGGCAIVVGHANRVTAANFRLESPSALRAWLAEAVS